MQSMKHLLDCIAENYKLLLDAKSLNNRALNKIFLSSKTNWWSLNPYDLMHLWGTVGWAMNGDIRVLFILLPFCYITKLATSSLHYLILISAWSYSLACSSHYCLIVYMLNENSFMFQICNHRLKFWLEKNAWIKKIFRL